MDEVKVGKRFKYLTVVSNIKGKKFVVALNTALAS